MAELTLGIDGRCLLAPVAGTARFVRELGLGLQAAFDIDAVLVYGRAAMPPVHDTPESQAPGWQTRAEPNPLWRRLPDSLWYRWRAGKLATQDGLSVFLAGANFLPGGWSEANSRSRSSLKQPVSVLLVHDLVPELYPQTLTWRHRLAYRWWRQSSIEHCEILVANSHGTAKRIQARYGRAPDLVLHPPVAQHFRLQDVEAIARVRDAYQLPERYLLSVGTLEPRKNLATLVKACTDLKAQGTDIGALVIAGARGWLADSTDAAIAAARDKGLKVLVLGYVPDPDLPALYAGCELFVLPSLYEGYGMPVAEALCCGARVLATDLPETREAGGEAALYCEPTVDGLMAGVKHALAQRPAPVGLQKNGLQRDGQAQRWASQLGQLVGLVKARLR